MKNLLMVLALGLLTGCSVQHIQPQAYDRYSDLQPMLEIQEEVQELPQLPLLTTATVNGEQVAVLTLEGVNTLSDFRDVARQNTQALQKTVDLYNATVVRDEILVESLKLEERRANQNDKLFVEAENARRDQERAQTIERTFYRTVIMLMGLAWTLL